MTESNADLVFQFQIALAQAEPLVWRRIQVPATYSFWEMNVAIRNVFKWTGDSGYEFQPLNPASGHVERIGSYLEVYDDIEPVILGEERYLKDYFAGESAPVLYLHDFGNEWRAVMTFEGASPALQECAYPRCIAGRRAAPPIGCGLTQFILTHEFQSGRFQRADFDPAAVVFEDPAKRWRDEFGGSGH